MSKTHLSPSLPQTLCTMPDDEGKPNPWASHGQEAPIKPLVLMMNNYSLLPVVLRSQAGPRTVTQGGLPPHSPSSCLVLFLVQPGQVNCWGHLNIGGSNTAPHYLFFSIIV